MTLDWVYEGSNVGFPIAHDRGFYRDAGLDVSITHGKGSGNTAQPVANKGTQVGVADRLPHYTLGAGPLPHLRRPHVPVNTGLRFAMKAARPSL